MRVTFVSVGQEQLAISLLSALLRREGHETHLSFHPALFNYDGFVDIPALARLLDRTDDVIDDIVASDPDLVAFSVLTASYQWSLRVAEAVKARTSASVIFGGVHPSAVPEVCLENDAIDYVCVGEGEDALVELCDGLPEQGRRPAEPIGNLWWRDGDQLVAGPARQFLGDLDSLPYFDKSIWSEHIRVADTWMTMSSRGCPHRCTFCFNNFFAKLPGKGGGKYLRQRSIDHMMGELVEAKADWGIRRVDFEDDIFTVDKRWIHDFLIEYRREIDVPFQCLIHPRYIDHDMARWLADAGCQHVQMGVQSVDEEYKRHQLLRMEKDSHLRNALAALRDADLDLKLDHMLGLPGEPLRAQELAREIYAEFPPRRIQTFWLVHLPGVGLTASAVESGDLSHDDHERLKRGEVRHYHVPDGETSAASDLYRRYELLFRLMTVVPKPVARRLRVRHIPSMPPIVGHAVGMSVEVVNAAINRDAETANYLRFYAHQLRRQLPGALRDRLRRRDRASVPMERHRTMSAPTVATAPTTVPSGAGSSCGTGDAASDGAVPVSLTARR